MFDLRAAAAAMLEVNACRAAHPQTYVKVNAFDARRGWETLRLSFIVNRPTEEPGFRLQRTEAAGRLIRYTTHAHAADKPEGHRY
jgi:ribulose-bisphosphate carboxylase small chain